LSGVAHRQTEINHVHERSLDELLAALMPVEAEPATQVERRIDARYRREVLGHASMLLQSLSDEELGTYWPRLFALSAADPSVERLCHLVGERVQTASPSPSAVAAHGGVVIVDGPA